MKNGDLDDLLKTVISHKKYRLISPQLIKKVGQKELEKGRTSKETVKATLSKLHQIGSSYQEKGIDYTFWKQELEKIPAVKSRNFYKSFCRRMMAVHASTCERLALLDSFFETILAEISPITSVMDLACGLNPLAIPWMPLAPDVIYFASDIYTDLIDFLPHYFSHLEVDGHASIIDLTSRIPTQPVQLALLLKAIPCLEQLDKNIGNRLLGELNAEHILASFPIQSLGGRNIGMSRTYAAHFSELTVAWKGTIRQFKFDNELVFLLSR